MFEASMSTTSAKPAKALLSSLRCRSSLSPASAVLLLMAGSFSIVASATASRAQMPDATRSTASPFNRMADADGRTIPCVCSIAGRLVPLGAVACLSMPDGRQLARCELATNVTSWVPTGVECPVSRYQSPIPNPRT